MTTEAFSEFTANRNPVEYMQAARIARAIYEYTRRPEVVTQITLANQPNKHSDEVKNCLHHHVVQLGFEAEKQNLFREYETRNVCPDFYLGLSKDRGVIFEVEKSRTIENNNDIFDLWKCHICRSAQYLILMVPLTYRSGLVYPRVLKRLAPFFMGQNYINVDGLFVMGY